MLPKARTRNDFRLLLVILVSLASLRPHPVGAQQEDVCMPEEFFTVKAIYFPFETDINLSHQWFSLDAGRERVDTFPNDTEYVGFIDAYDLGFRHIIVGTHENRQIISIDSCFLQQLPEPAQAPICFAEGAQRQEAVSLGYAPLQNLTLEDTSGGQAFTRVDALSAEIGSVSVPVRIIERISGNAFLLVEFWNFRLEVDFADLAIPTACDGVPPPGASGTSSTTSQLRELVSEGSWDLLQRMPTARRLLSTGDR